MPVDIGLAPDIERATAGIALVIAPEFGVIGHDIGKPSQRSGFTVCNRRAIGFAVVRINAHEWLSCFLVAFNPPRLVVVAVTTTEFSPAVQGEFDPAKSVCFVPSEAQF